MSQETRIRYWKDRLSLFSRTLPLPTGGERQEEDWRRCSVDVDVDSCARLHRLSAGRPFLLHAAVMGVVQLCLGSRTGARVVSVGVPLQPGAGSRTIGLLPVVAELDPGSTFALHLNRVKDALVGAHEHALAPFERLLEALRVPVRVRCPLFDAVVSLSGLHGSVPRVGQILEVEFDDLGAALRINVVWRGDLFDTAWIEGFADHLRGLLAAGLGDPSLSLDDLPAMGNTELAFVLRAGTGSPSSGDKRLLPARLRERALADPRAVAVRTETEKLTYGGLLARIEAAAQRLREAGVGPDRLVAIQVAPGVDTLVLPLAVLFSGGAFLILDPEWPSERIAAALGEARPALLVGDSNLEGRVGDLDVPRLRQGELAAWCSAHQGASARYDESRADPEGLAYVIYTSGSTGIPKGVMVSQGSLAGYLDWCCHAYPEAAGTVPLHTSPAVDLTLTSMFLPLLCGGTVRVLPVGAGVEPLRGLLSREPIGMLKLTPSHLLALGEGLAAEARIGLLVVGGEALDDRHLRGFRDRSTRIVNEYGPAEATVACIARVLSRAEMLRKPVPIGEPLPDVGAFVLGGDGRLLAPGSVGELAIGGPGLARGYLHHPMETASRFMPATLPGTKGDRLYLTGDLVRLAPDGLFEYVGRKDSQIKIRGHRVEPGEIEASLLEHPAVKEAAVIVGSDPGGDPRLEASVVLTRRGISPASLRRHLRRRLPSYMVPPVFSFLDELPRTSAGKIDRQSLGTCERTRDEADLPAPPHNELEHALAAVWSEILGMEISGIHDNFFTMGGDSILAMRLVGRAQGLGILLDPAHIFEHPTVAGLARVARRTGGDTAVSGVPEPMQGTVPLAPVQRWFFERSLPALDHYNQAMLLEAAAPLDRGALETALHALVDRHDALRLRFERRSEGWRQVCVKSSSAPLLIPVEGEPADLTMYQRGLDLAAGPLLRCLCWRPAAAGARERLLLIAHHLVIDGYSWRVLLEDLRSAYEQARVGLTPALPPATTSFGRWVDGLPGLDVEGRPSRDYWLRQLSSVHTPLPLDGRGAAKGLEDAAERIEGVLPEALTVAMEACRHVVSTEVILLAAMARVLSRWTSGRAHLLDLERAGRVGADTSRTVGWFTSLFPFSLVSDAREPAQDTVARTREDVMAIPLEGIGFGYLRYSLEDAELIAADRSAGPRVLSFNYLGRFEAESDPNLSLYWVQGETGDCSSARNTRAHPLEFIAIEVGGALRVRWVFDPAHHRRERVQELHTWLIDELNAVVEGVGPGERRSPVSDESIPALPQGTSPVVARCGLSPVQRSILLACQGTDSPGLYLTQFVCSLDGNPDAGILERAWRRVVDRIPTLRTFFDGSAMEQGVLASVPVKLCMHDWTRLSPDQVRDALEQAVAAGRRCGMDLAEAPLFTLDLFRCANKAHFVWTYHHILLDGWSSSAVLGQVAAEYAELCGEPRLEPTEPPPFSDYIGWLESRGDDQDRRYWADALAGYEPPPILSASGTGGAPLVLDDLLSAAESEGLADLARGQGLTLGSLVLGAWAVTLGAYLGVDDLVIGIVGSGRPPDLPGSDRIIGAMIDTLPLRLCTAADAVPRDWLAGFQRDHAEARRHGHRTAAEVRELAGLAPGAPLFDSIATFENYPRPVWAGDTAGRGLRIGDVSFREQTEFPLTLHAIPGAPSLRLQVTALPDRFAPDLARALLASLIGRLRYWHRSGLSGSLHLTGETKTLSGPAERIEPVPPPCLHHRFQQAAERYPDRIALRFEGESISYRELAARIHRLARHLRHLGVGPEVRVGICLQRNPDLVVAILAVLEANGVYVPMDVTDPPGRVAQIAGNADLSLAISAEERAEIFAGEGLGPVLLEAHAERIAAWPAEAPPDHARTDNAAYVIHTSGSTGTPKGVLVTHGSVSRLLDAVAPWMSFGPGDTWTLAHSPAFDFSVWELWGALAYGGRLVIVPHWMVRDPEAFHGLLHEERVSVLNQTPSAFYQLDAIDRERAAARPLQLRLVVFGGEALSPKRLEGWFDRHGDALPELFNVYGITETTVHVSCRRIRRDDVDGPIGSPIGRPLADLEIHLLDAAMHPVPDGAPGEIYVGGPGVARGYLCRPDLTAAAFVPDPFSGRAGDRIYRTGDRARWRGEGQLEFLGRIDQQVKVRGYRIEPGEIESALLRDSSVSDAAVAVRRQSGHSALMAYVVPDAQAAPFAARELALAAQGRLDRERCHRLPDGLFVAQINRPETEFTWSEVFEQESYLRHGVELHDGAVVIDVGANIGIFTLFTAHRCRTARLIAFEPLPSAFEALELNCALHGVTATLERSALGAEAGTSAFAWYPNATVLSGRYADPDRERALVGSFLTVDRPAGYDAEMLDALLAERLVSESIECPVTTLSAVMDAEGLDVIDLLKIDVEKSEAEVFKGIDDRHWPLIRQIVVEVHDIQGRLTEMCTELERHGFVVAVDQEPDLRGSELHMLYARRALAGYGRHRQATPRAAGEDAGHWCERLRAGLADRLPSYMVPTVVLALSALPLTASGKLDRARLPAPVHGRHKGLAGTPTERILAEIWAKVLGIDEVGIEDDFFRLGGDSIQAMQIAVEARRRGIKLDPGQLFECPTIAALAQVIIESGGELATPEAPLVGVIPLTPIQHWFFEQDFGRPQHWNQCIELIPDGPLDPNALSRALAWLAGRHDALRLRFEWGAGGWQQTAVPADEVQIPLEVQEVRGEDDAQEIKRELQAGLCLERGPLFRVLLMRMPRTDRGGQTESEECLFLVAHHLLVDGVSWRVLVEDLARAYEAYRVEAEPDLADPVTPFTVWAARLARQSASDPGLEEERSWWQAEAARAGARLALDAPPADDHAADAVDLRMEFDDSFCDALLAAGSEATIEESLLVGTLIALGEWLPGDAVRLAFESHGRSDVVAGSDLTHTVGWFTSLFPVRFELPRINDLDGAFASVLHTLRAVPGHGIGYGRLRYLSDHGSADSLVGAGEPQILFNYLGRFSSRAVGPFKSVRQSEGGEHAPSSHRPFPLEIMASLQGRRIEIQLRYGGRHLSTARVGALAEALNRGLGEVRRHLLRADGGAARVLPPPEERAQLQQRYGDLEDLLLLSPVQQGLLFHALYSSDPTLYLSQFGWRMAGYIDPERMRRAWEHAVRLHGMLRTTIIATDVSHPLQMIRRDPVLDWVYEDWRDLPEAERKTRYRAWVEDDRRRGFDFSAGPPMRVALLRMGDTHWEVIWTHHHVLIDGWSSELLLRDVFSAFDGDLTERPEPAPAYRDYLEWRARQDDGPAAALWRKVLGDRPAPTKVDSDRLPPPAEVAAREGIDQRRLSAVESAALRAFASSAGVTLNTLLQGVWALFLASVSGSRDLIFGGTVSGRPTTLPTAEEIVGLFVTTLPVRVRLIPERPVSDWLKGLQREQAELRRFEQVSLAEVRRWIGVGRGEELFESALVFENLPDGVLVPPTDGSLTVSDQWSFVRNSFPLTLRVVPGDRIELHVLYDTARYVPGHAVWVNAQVHGIVNDMCRSGDRTVAVLLAEVEERQRKERQGAFAARDEGSLKRLRDRTRRSVKLEKQV